MLSAIFPYFIYIQGKEKQSLHLIKGDKLSMLFHRTFHNGCSGQNSIILEARHLITKFIVVKVFFLSIWFISFIWVIFFFGFFVFSVFSFFFFFFVMLHLGAFTHFRKNNFFCFFFFFLSVQMSFLKKNNFLFLMGWDIHTAV